MISRKNILEFEARRKIYNFILENPGLHLSEISRKTETPKTTLRHHLKYLKENNLINSKLEDNYKRYYPIEKYGQTEKKILALIRKDTTRRILTYMFMTVTASQIEIAFFLKKRTSTIYFHLKKMEEIGLIERVPVDNKGRSYCWGNQTEVEREYIKGEKLYRFKDQKTAQIVYHMLLAINKYNLPDLDFVYTLDHFILFIQCINLNRPPGKIKTTSRSFDDAINRIFEIFPHPYHV